MFTAKNPRTQDVYRFRTLDALARRLGGDDFHVCHSEAFAPVELTIEVLRTTRYGTSIVTTLLVPPDALPREEL